MLTFTVHEPPNPPADRVDRAEKFGYCCPPEPWFPNGRSACAPRCGFGIGCYRLR